MSFYEQVSLNEGIDVESFEIRYKFKNPELSMRFQTLLCVLVGVLGLVKCWDDWFDYDNVENWGWECHGQNQSPININSKDVDVCPMETFFRMHAPCEDLKLEPEGQCLRVEAEDKNFISLIKMNIFNWYVKMWNYRSTHFSFHSPSEHTINHQHFDLEMQVMHEWFMLNFTEMEDMEDMDDMKDAEHFNFSEMMFGYDLHNMTMNRTHYLPDFHQFMGNQTVNGTNGTNDTDSIGYQEYAILSLLFKVDYHIEEDVFDTFIKYMNDDHGMMDYNYTFEDMMTYMMMNNTNDTNSTNSTNSTWHQNNETFNYTEDNMWANLRESFECVGFRYFYHYLGSLTTPPCTESVQWFVMRDPLPIRPDKLEFFHRELNHGWPNNRPVQDYNDREVSLVSQWQCIDYKIMKIWQEFGDYDKFFDEMQQLANQTMNSTWWNDTDIFM